MRSADPLAVAALILGLLALPACTRHAARVDDTTATCRSAFPGKTVVGAYPTTVGSVRERSVGPGRRPAAGAGPGRGAADAAAWCYVGGDERRAETAAAAVRGEAPVVFASGGILVSSSGPAVP